jgi:cell division protein FtsI/penicillin-binding protein 2
MLRRNLAGCWLICVLACMGAPQVAWSRSPEMLQAATTRAMTGRSGAVVVLDIASGHVLASYHLDVAARRVIHPGSSIKPFTLLALLEAGKLNAHSALMCKRSVVIGGHRLDCSHPETHQPLDPAEALAYSCNSYFTTVATRLTPAELRDSLVRDGFASVTGLAPNEAAGNIALAATPEQLQLQAIGEWGVSVTPLEMARAYRALALQQAKHDDTLAPLFDGLAQSVGYGMGHIAQPAAAMKVAGKTGTAAADEGTWTHAWFAGYAPADRPEIVLVVFLEKGHGGSEAATVARDIFAAFADAYQSAHAQAPAGVRP